MNEGRIIPLHPVAAMGTLIRYELEKRIEEIFPLLRPLHNRATHGGSLCLGDVRTGRPFLVCSFGYAFEEKADKYDELCREKARRLGQHIEHRSSAQSRNDEAGQYGGAVRGLRMILSFSGMPWELDESFCLILGMALGEFAELEAIKIAELSGNTRFAEALVACKTT